MCLIPGKLYFQPEYPQRIPVLLLGETSYGLNNEIYVVIFDLERGEEYLTKKDWFVENKEEYFGNIFREYKNFDYLIQSNNVIRGIFKLSESEAYHKRQEEKLQEENKNLKRENKILKVLAENKRQTYWKAGNLIPGRVAECVYGCKMVLSEDSLPFFKKRPDRDTDKYYCGSCYGWD